VPTTPSRWLSDRVEESSLFRGKKAEVIPNPIDTNRFRPIDKKTAKEILGLPTDCRYVLFGAVSASTDTRKGHDLLIEALEALGKNALGDDVRLLVFGTSHSSLTGRAGSIPASFLGYVHDDVAISLMNSAAEVAVVPSRQESFGQTASEAMACGTPVVAFGATSLKEVVDDGVTGFLAEPYDAPALGQCINKVLNMASEDYRAMSEACRAKAIEQWSMPVVAQQHKLVYDRILSERKPRSYPPAP
jgi:glycosyltransferase involved in cell wall biosynthesis